MGRWSSGYDARLQTDATEVRVLPGPPKEYMTRIHVRRDLIAADRKNGTVSNAIGVETTGMRKRYGKRVEILGRVTFVYRPERPLHCGARAWAETTGRVVVHRG